MLRQYAAQKSVAAKRARAQLTQYAENAHNYVFKLTPLNEDIANILPLELQTGIKEFLGYMQQLKELEQSAERHIDFEAIRQDIETLKQQILVTEDENNEDQVESTNKLILPLSDIEMRLLPLWQYYLTKVISNGLNNSHQIVLSDINDGFYESMPTLSCATLQLVKLLSSDKFKRFYLMWSLLQKHLPELEINHLIDYLNGSYREFATFARLLQNANYRQQLNSLATRVLCTHVLEDRDLEISSRYVYEGPSFTNCLVSVLFNKEGKLKSMPLQDLDCWRVSLQQLRQLLWHNGTLMSKQYALSRNNLQLAKQNGQKLLKEVEYVREVCKEKLAEGEFEDFQQAFEKLVTSLDEELSRQSHDDCSLVLRESIKEEQMQYHGSILHALIGSLELCLLTFTPLIDPVEKQKLKTAYIDEDINCLKMLSTTYDCMRVVMHYKNFGVKVYDAFATQLHALLEKRDKCATKVAIRPKKCHYSALVQDITHFLHTNCNPVSMHAVLLQVQDTWRILHSHELNGEQLSGVTEVLSKLDLWIANSQRFVNHILKPYKAFYEDFLQPLQCAVDQMRFGFEGLKKCLGQVHAALILKPKSQRYINLNAQGRLHEILLNVVSFPSAQKLNIYDENAPRDIFKNRAHIFTMLEGLSNSERVYFRLLQAKLHEILQSSQIGSLMSEQDFRAYDYALHICNEVWQTEENQRQQQKAEEESLYVQKALCVEEDEELVELQEIAEHFPADIEADFGDFIVQDTLEKVMKLDKKPLKKKPSHVLGDEEYAFLAENFIQLMLQHTKVFYHEPQTAQQMELQLLAPFQQRLEVFVQLFGKYKTALNESLNTAVFNSFTLALGLQQQLLNEMELKGGSSINLKHYNYYKDANIPEVRSCCEILCRIELHVQQQLELYAEHATLEDILRIIERIRHLPASASLVRFNMGFQLLRQKIAQWNEVAHKGNHLRDEEIVIAEHVQRWTRLELQCWRNCLQQTEQKMAGQAYRYWFFIYNLLQEYFTQGNLDSSYTDIKHTEQRFGEASIYDMPTNNDTMTTKVTLDEIMRIVRQFIEAANYGDFHMRLRLLHAFELYIHNVKNYIVEEDERLTPLIASLRNMQIYYAQFGTEISQTCKNMRAPIEKKLKEFVKIESYNKDLSYFSMRNNVARVHRQLNKFLREYRTQLQTKIMNVFQPQDATVKDYEFHGAKDYETRFKEYKQPTQLFIAPLKLRDLYADKTINETSVDNETQTLMQRVSKLFSNSRNVVKSTVENSKYPQLIMCLDELLHGQLERCEHLRNLSVDRTREKAQQKVEAKQILQQKRKALIDLFKTLSELGVSYKSGLLELGLKTEFADFSLEPFCMKNMLPHSGKTVNLVKLSENLDTYYAKCVFKLRLLQNVMLTPLSELGPPTIERIKGCAVDLFLIVQKQRVLLAHSSKSMFDLRSGLENLRYLASACEKGVGMQNLSFANSRDTFVVLRESVCRMRFVFEQLQLVLNCAPSQQSTETQVFAIADARFLKQSSQFTKFEELCQRMLQLCKDTLQDMSTNDVEFLSLNKIKAYEETHGKLIELIKQLMTMLRASDNDAENYLPLAQPLQDLLIMAENAHEMEKVNNSLDIDLGEVETALEAVLHSVLMALQKLYKKYSETVEKEPSEAAQDAFENDVLEEQHLRKKLLEELSIDWEILNLPHIVQQLTHILLSLKHADVSDEKLIYCRHAVSMLPLLEQYQLMADFYLLQQLGSHRVSAKLLSALLTVFVEIGTKGFCVPPDLMQDEDGGKKGEQKEGEGFGLEDGTGEKDASDKLESEDQLDDAKRPEDRKNEEEKEDPDCKEEKGIEMSDDFDGKMQDVEKPENEEDDSGESEEEDELNKEMGETEDGAEKLDDQIWGDDEEPEEEEEEEKDMEEEDGKGSKDEKDSHNDLDSKNDAAKEDGKNNEEKEGLDATDEPSGDDRKKQEKDIDNMKDEQGDDEQTNPYHNELEEPPEPEEMELGDMNHDNEDDNEEGDEREDNENPFDIDRMKESMPAAEETPNDEEEAGEENTDEIKETEDNAGDSESEDEAGTELKEDVNAGEDEDENKQQEEETGEPETQKRGELEPEDTAEADEEKDEETHKEKPEDHAQSKDKSSKEENVQSVPETDEKATADQVESEQNDKNVKQEEKLDEQDTGEEKDGVGQAENEEKDGGHKGIAETKETIARDDSKNERKPEEKRKQGKTDEERTLGEAEHNKLKQLKTIDKLKHENDKDNKDDLDVDKPEDEEMEAEEYQHIKEPKNSDRTTLDNATEDQSKQIKHQEDEEKKDDMEEEAENADELNADEDEAMAVDDDVEEMKADKLEQKSEKPSKSSDKTKERAETQQEQVEIEGEYALTMDVSRGAETTAHCSKDLLLDTSQAEELSVAETLELRRKYQQQITTHLMTRPEHDDHETWQSVSQRMSQSARELCEQLRLILEPTKCTRLKGDYRTGRRINMKKIIPYIASQFRKDKIWLRRTKPAQRDYKITIAIDDSKSMHHNNSKTLTLEAISLVSQALTLLESGRLSVVSFGERPQIILNHIEQFDGPKLVSALNFEQDKTKIAELLDFMRTANAEEGLGGSDNGLFENLLLVLSDGRNIFGEGKLKVKNAIKLARLQRIFLVYIIIDNPENKNSILDIQTMEMLPDKRISIKSYLDDFPFPYYVIVRDLKQLPLVLSEAMRQWFELVNSEQ